MIHSTTGCFQLVANTEDEVDRDMEFLHSLEDLQMIDYTVQCPHAPSYGTVVVVDPFSTGKCNDIYVCVCMCCVCICIY